MASVASILKSRIVNGNAVASIDGNYIKAARLPQAVPALANVVSIDPTTGELAYQASAAPPGGPFLPLAGGTMDAFPAGVISAHTINELTNITGASAGPGNDTIIQTINGNDLSLNTDPTESITANTGQFEINAEIRCEINGATVIQPVGGYTYPNNPEIGLSVQNWTNPTGFQQIGIGVNNITSAAGQVEGVYIQNLNANQDCVGVRLDNVNGNNLQGVEINNLTANGDAQGQRISGVQGNRAWGHAITSVSANAGDAKAIEVDGITSLAGATYGLEMNNLQGDALVKGVDINSLTAFNGNATGVAVGTLLSSAGGDAVGADLTQITSSAGIARGVNIDNVNGFARAFGVVMDSITATGSVACGMNMTNINSTNGANRGIVISNIGSPASITPAGSRGIQVNQVQQDPTNPATSSVGIETALVSANNSIGMRAINIQGENSATGIETTSISTPSGESKGINIVQSLGATRAYGAYIQQITSGASISAGIRIDDVVGGAAGGGGATAYGLLVSGVASDPASAPLNPAYGAFFQRVSGATNKLASDDGQQVKLRDGNLGLAVQFCDATNAVIEQDGGNYVVLDATAPANIILNPATGSGLWENGSWFVICKNHAGPHLINIPAIVQFNAQALGAPWAFGGGPFDFLYLFYNNNVWYAKQW